MANAGRGGVDQPLWGKKQQGLGAHVSKFSSANSAKFSLRTKLVNLDPAPLPLRFPFRPGLSARPGSRPPFRAFFFLSSFFVRLQNPSSGPLPRLFRPTPGAAAPLTMASCSSGPRIASSGSTEHKMPGGRGDKQSTESWTVKCQDSQTGRPVVVEIRQRLTPILTTWTLGGAEAWQMEQVLSCPVRLSCSTTGDHLKPRRPREPRRASSRGGAACLFRLR